MSYEVPFTLKLLRSGVYGIPYPTPHPKGGKIVFDIKIWTNSWLDS